MKRRLANVFALFLVLFFASFTSGPAKANSSRPCEVSPQAPPTEKISITITDPFQADQVAFKTELLSLVTDMLRDDSKGITDNQKYKRLKRLAKRIQPIQESRR